MKYIYLSLVLFCCSMYLKANDDFNLNGLNETSFIYRTAQDSLHTYFRNALGLNLSYKYVTAGLKFIAELPKYRAQSPYTNLDANSLQIKWAERFIEYNNNNLLLHGGIISESFGSGMVFRCWEDLEFETDTRIEGFLAKYENNFKLKALYGILPNTNQVTKSDLVYGADAEYPIIDNIHLGTSALTIRTWTVINEYNQQDVYAGRMNFYHDLADAGIEYAYTSLFDNGTANRQGRALVIYANTYPQLFGFKSVEIGTGYKNYYKFHYRLQDLRTMNYHNETLADNESSGEDEEGLQGLFTISPVEDMSFTANYAESWNSKFTKRMNDFYSAINFNQNETIWTLEYSHIEKIDKTTSHWQKEMKPTLLMSRTMNRYSFEAKTEFSYVEKVNHDVETDYYEPFIQLDLGIGKVSLSSGLKSHWKSFSTIIQSNYWLNCELKYNLWNNTDIILFAGKQAGGKVCRNGVCRFVSPFQGVKLEAITRF